MLKYFMVVVIGLTINAQAYAVITIDDLKSKIKEKQNKEMSVKEFESVKKFLACVDRQEVSTDKIKNPEEVRIKVRKIIEKNCATEILEFNVIQKEEAHPKK